MWRTLAASTTFVLVILGLAGGVPKARAQGRAPNFPVGVALSDSSGRNGVWWLGGDAPSGTNLAPDVSFWAFGDTFLSVPGVQGRSYSSVVGNTIAIGQIQGGRFVPRYFYRGTIAKKKAFFPDPDSAHKYWPKASVVVRGKLYVFLTLMYIDPDQPADSLLGAQETGVMIARVNNPMAIPTIWDVDYLTFHVENPNTQANLKLGWEVIRSRATDSLVVYGFFNNAVAKANKSVVVLISNGALAETPGGTAIDTRRCQYLAAGPGNAEPRWKPGLGDVAGTTEDYFDTQIDCVSGYTVRWNSILGKWQVVGANSQYAAMHAYPPGNPYVPIPYARIFLHPTPFGPFLTSPQASNSYFYTFPEVKSPDPTLYCYGARQWQDPNDPVSSNDANILLTYTYSSRDVNRLIVDFSTYQNAQVVLPNPYTGTAPNPARGAIPAPSPDGAKVPPSPLPSKGVVPDPFAAPGAPQPLPFPAR